MSSITFAVVAAILLFLLVKLLSVWRQMSKMPPGPFSIPFIGSISALVRKQQLPEYLHSLTRQYGELATVWVGMKPTVIISSMKAVRAAFINRSDFDSRPDSIIFDLFDRGTENTLLTMKFTERWKSMKKLTVSALRSVMEANPLDNIIETESQDAIEGIRSKADGKTTVDLALYIPVAIYSCILKTFFGESCKLDDPEFLHFQRLCLSMNSHWSGAQYADKMPWIRRLPKSLIYQLPQVKQLKEDFAQLTELVGVKFKRQADKLQNHSKDGQIRSLFDVFFEQKEIFETRAKKDQTDFAPTIQRITDLFIASVDSTSNTLNWYLQFMALNPEAQQRCFEEIKKATGNRAPKLDDRANMPFLEATIMETLRLKPFSSFGIAHTCDTDQQLLGYTIPKGTDLIVDTYALHSDPEVYKNPNCFDPTNFLDSIGCVFRPPNFFSFGVGRRVCVGDNLAKKILFLTAATFLQKFEFLPIPGRQYNDTAGDSADIFLIAEPFEVLVKLRNA